MTSGRFGGGGGGGGGMCPFCPPLDPGLIYNMRATKAIQIVGVRI